MSEEINKINLEILKKENDSLKDKIEALRRDNNSFLYTALCKAQFELPIVQKNMTAYGKQKYADLAEIIRVSRPILTKHGLSVTQTFNTIEDNTILKTSLCHISGQCISSEILLAIPKADANKTTNMLHEAGKAITYFRRYSYSAIVGIATDEDSDGN